MDWFRQLANFACRDNERFIFTQEMAMNLLKQFKEEDAAQKYVRNGVQLEGHGNDTFINDSDDHMNIEDDSLVKSVIHVLHQKIDEIMAQQITSTNSSLILDPTVVVHSLESTKTSDLTSIMKIQPKKLFHSNITCEATTPPNGQPHIKVGAVLPKWWTLIAFEPTPLMMLTDSQAAIAAYIFSNTSEELVISNEKGYRSTFRYLVPERCVGSRVINLVALMMTRELHWYLVIVDFTSRRRIILDSLPCVGKHQQCKRNAIKVATYLEAMLDDHIFYDDKSKVVDCSTFWPMTPFGLPTQKNRSIWVTDWIRECTLQDDFNIQINGSTRMRLAVDLV
ncbi:hypothetical protein Ahy_A07g035988 [Arachis hypogaea]|uniref:Uncharacterized protein n=1 Tax=Arachis hypogaea TaxID=3818 RepID=A0A445CEY4_ARAHY|nr:hypothetical protein Ahy_A07g035988 [Arachis hypogaea]